MPIGWLRRWWPDVAIMGAWAASVVVVIALEQGPWGWSPRLLAQSINAGFDVNEQWFGVYYQGQKVGYTHVMILPDERQGQPGFSIRDHGRLRFTLMGVPQVLEIKAHAFIDATFALTEFAALVQAEQYRLELKGRRVGDTVELTLIGPGSSLTRSFRDPAGRMWMSGLASWTTFHRLRVGQAGHLEVLNPLAMKPESMYFSVPRQELMNGHNALVIEQDYHGLTARTWMTPDGVVLKETSPMGWELLNEPMQQAVAGISTTVDLLSTTAVPVDQPLPDPASITQLTLVMIGADAEQLDVDRRPWQEVLPPETLGAHNRETPSGAWCVVRLRRPQLQHEPGPPPNLEPYRTPGPLVQSDDPLLARRAAQVVGAETDRWRQALLLQEWVHRTLTKRLSVGLPTAKDVLNSLSGDCHEHTVLFAGLARAAGLPTRMMAGLVYYGDRFYYHAWPEVWIDTAADGRGLWMPLDPTLGQVPADSTHLGLVEAEGEELVALAQFVGQVQLSVLERVP